MSPAVGAARLAAIEERIEAACRRAGRERADVTLLGASKGQPIERLRAAWEAGLADFAENRVQEAMGKAAELPAGVRWHLIGPLQKNKAKKAVALFRSVHSLDRLEIGEALARHAAEAGRRLPCFLEVNLGGEASKHGFAPEALPAAVETLLGLSALEIAGLMAIPPYDPDPERSRPYFRSLRELARGLAERFGRERFGSALSMGMSEDFEVAVEEGATHLRVGTALFGPREAPGGVP